MQVKFSFCSQNVSLSSQVAKLGEVKSVTKSLPMRLLMVI